MRYFLLDKVTELVPGERARGIKCVTLSDEILHDHFPDYPIFPGVLLVEAGAQLAGFLVERSLNPPHGMPRRALLVQIGKAKFRRPAQPGDRIELCARLKGTLETAAEVEITATVEAETAMRATLTFMLKEVASERVHAERERLYRLWTRELDGNADGAGS